MQVYVAGKLVGSDTTLPDGMYTIVSSRINIDQELLKFSRVICSQDNKYAESQLNFNPIPDHIFQAKVPNLKLRSTEEPSYTKSEAVETINAVMIVTAVRLSSGEISQGEANARVTARTNQVLSKTELGNNPEATIGDIRDAVRRRFDNNLPHLRLLEDYAIANEVRWDRRPFCDSTKQEQTDLSGTYTGKVKRNNEPVQDATLTITGNDFTWTSGSATHSGRITAVTTCGYTAVTMMIGDLTPPPPSTNPPAAHPTMSLRAKKVGDILTLTSVPGEPQTVTFTTGGAAMKAKPRRHRAKPKTEEPPSR